MLTNTDHHLGKGEVVSSILTSSTTNSLEIKDKSASGKNPDHAETCRTACEQTRELGENPGTAFSSSSHAERIDRTALALTSALHQLPENDRPHDLACDLGLIFRARLGRVSRLFLAIAAVRALDKDVARELAGSILDETGTGMPGAPFDDVTTEAALWADMAEDDEISVYLTACFNRLTERDRAAFLDHAGRGA